MASDYYRVTDTETRLRSVGHSIGLVVAAFIAGIAASMVLGQVLLFAGVIESGAKLATLPPLVVAAIYASQPVGYVAVVYLYVTRYAETTLFDVDVPSLRDIAWAVGGFAVLFALAAVVGYVLQQLGIESATNQVIEVGRANPVVFLYMIGVTFLFVAPAEELLYRGVVQGLFRKAYGVVPGVLLASGLFGAAHYFAVSGSGKITYLAIAAMLGLVLGAAYEHTENLTVSIIIHALWNTYLFGSQYLVATGAIQG